MNNSSVNARFNVIKIEDDAFKDNSFSLNIHSGEIEP